MTYIIDGHNLIGVLPDIHLADPGDEARLLRRLRAHRTRHSSGPMIVFFDAGSSGGGSRPRRPSAGTAIEARFANPGQTADDAIVAFLRGVAQPGQYAVVTDDQELTWRVRALGASTIRASEFAVRLAPQAFAERASPKAGHTGPVEEPAPDPHAPAFADLYAGFMSADKNRTHFPEKMAADVSAWTEKLYSEDPGEAQRAARWLGQYGGKEALEPLKDALTHSDARVRAAALLAMADLGDQRALPAMCERLANDGASMARQAAAQSLGRIGDRSVETALETAAGADTKNKVRKAARDALVQVRARGARPPS
jgi:uncharacterized protein